MIRDLGYRWARLLSTQSGSGLYGLRMAWLRALLRRFAAHLDRLEAERWRDGGDRHNW